MNSSNLFYVSEITIQNFILKKMKLLQSLFFSENYLFSLIKQESDDDLSSKIKIEMDLRSV